MNRVSVLGAESERMRKCPGTAPPGPSAGARDKMNPTGIMCKRVELLDQIDKNATRSGLGEDVGEHHDAGDVLETDTTSRVTRSRRNSA